MDLAAELHSLSYDFPQPTREPARRLGLNEAGEGSQRLGGSVIHLHSDHPGKISQTTNGNRTAKPSGPSPHSSAAIVRRPNELALG
jgi:hypothetical protein